MTTDSAVTSRRTGLAGMAALLLSALSRPADARRDETEDGAPPPCCGNGPPNVASYGIGQPVTPLGPCTLDLQFLNPFFGKKGQKSQYAWVFTPNEDVVATLYLDPMGNPQTPPVPWPNPPLFHGLAWYIAPGYTLDLEWPSSSAPTWSTRPFGASENLP